MLLAHVSWRNKMDPIFQSLQTVVDRYDELNEQLADPEIAGDG